MSIIKFSCPYCGQVLEADDSFAGNKAECWKCNGKFLVPAALPQVAPTKTSHKRAPQPQITQAPAKGFPIIPLVIGVLIIAGIVAFLFGGITTTSTITTKNSTTTSTPDQLPITKPKNQTKQPTNKAINEATDQPTKNVTKQPENKSTEKPTKRQTKTDLKQPQIIGLRTDKYDNPNKLRRFFTKKITDTLATQSINNALKDPAFRKNLMRHEILISTSGPVLNELFDKDQFKPFLKVFLNDSTWMTKFLTSGPIQAPTRTLNYLYIIWKHDKECTQPLYQTIATALALEKAKHDYKGEKQNYQTFRRYQNYKQAHQDLKLHGSFEKLKTWEMRFALEVDFNDKHFDFMLNDRNYMTNQYGGACWSCAYLTFNSFNDIVFGRDYYTPWEWTYSWAEKTRYVGGVCGSLSYHGSRMARVHGIASMTAGEPGHCAYCIRHSDGKWKRSYHVSWPTYPHNTFWGGSYTYLNLTENAFKVTSRVVKAHQYVWLAHYYNTKVEIDPTQVKLYKGRWGSLPDFTAMTPESTLKTTHFDYHKDFSVKDWFGLSYTGHIQIPSTQNYLINLKGDDFVNLYIDNKLVSKVVRRSAPLVTKKLTKGQHKFKIDFCERGGADYFSLNITPKQPNPKVLESYKRAVETAPLQYGIWQEYRQQLLKNSTPKQRIDFCKLAAKKLIQHQEAAWNLINNRPIFKGIDTAAKLKILLNLHKILKQTAIKEYINWPMNKILDTQVRLLDKNEEAAFKLFSKLLTIHANSKDYFMWVFNWGTERWSKNPKFTKRLNTLIHKLLKSNSTLEQGVVQDLLKSAILEASKNGNVSTFQQYTRTAQKILNMEPPAKAVKGFPQIKPFKGTLVSARGLLQLSSISHWNNPFRYLDLLSSTTSGGQFHTNREQNPYAQVKLRGKCKLSGLIIVNASANQQRAVPLKVSVSTNGKSWKTVFTTTEIKNVWRIDLARKKLKAKYIRVEGNYKAGRKDFFHLRNILIYGRKLY